MQIKLSTSSSLLFIRQCENMQLLFYMLQSISGIQRMNLCNQEKDMLD